MPKVVNATVHTEQGHVVVCTPTEAYIRLPGPGQMNAEGMQVTTLILCDPLAIDGSTNLFQSGDIFVVDERKDFVTPGQVTKYTIQKAYPSGTGRLVLWRVEVAGAIR